MSDKPPENAADHAEDFAQRWQDRLDRYCALRMSDLGVPSEKIGAPDYKHGISWCAFNPHDRDGGGITTGIVVDSGVFNPELLKGKTGARVWENSRLRDRIDAVIAHEYEESRHGTHARALRAAAGTDMPITGGARRILRAMAR